MITPRHYEQRGCVCHATFYAAAAIFVVYCHATDCFDDDDDDVTLPTYAEIFTPLRHAADAYGHYDSFAHAAA